MFNLTTFKGLYEVANENCSATINSVEENSFGEAMCERDTLAEQFRQAFPGSVSDAKENFENFDCKEFYEIIGTNPELMVPVKFDAFMADIENKATEGFYVPAWKSVIKH